MKPPGQTAALAVAPRVHAVLSGHGAARAPPYGRSQVVGHRAGSKMPVSERTAKTARYVLVAFLLTFITSRVLVFLIMTHRLPDLYLHVKGTHVHHLNYGIFLLVFVGAYLLFERPPEQRLRWPAIAYGVGLGLTFDEFGMWLHLGGPYWQRASFDAVVVVAGVIATIAFAPAWSRLRPHHFFTGVLLLLALAVFGFTLYESVHRFGNRIERLERLEETGPT